METKSVELPHESPIWTLPARTNDYRHPMGVVDGDTQDMDFFIPLELPEFDISLHTIPKRQRIRLYGIDTSEEYGVAHDSEEYQRGTEQAEFVLEWYDKAISNADEDFPFTVNLMRNRGKYGRWIGDVLNPEGNSLVAALFDEYGTEILDSD